MKQITEQDYLDAIRVINEYTEQVNRKTEAVLKKSGITKTPSEIGGDYSILFPSTSVRLWNVLKGNFNHRRICDITKKEFFSVRNAGKKSWNELCEITGKDYYSN